MANVFKKLRGTIENFFQLGIAPYSHGIADSNNGVEARTNGGAAQSNFVSQQALGGATAGTDANCTNLLDLKQRDVLLEFNFDGAIGIPGGEPVGSYGLCHTTGGAYTAGEIYIVTAPTVGALIPQYKMMNVCNLVATPVGATIGMIAAGFYTLRSAAAPWTSWVLMGDGTAGAAGEIRSIVIPFGTADFPSNKDSASLVPNGSLVSRTSVSVFTVFDAPSLATVEVQVLDGVPKVLMGPAESNLLLGSGNQFDSDEYAPIAGGGTQNVRLVLGCALSPVTGNGMVVVEYCATPLP